MPVRVSIDGQLHEVEIIARAPRLIVEIDGRRRVVEASDGDGRRRSVSFEGRQHHFSVARRGETCWARGDDGQTYRMVVEDPIAAARDEGAAGDEVRAPMPGAVIAVARRAGDAVQAGDLVMTIESMKLQTNLVAPRAGVLAEMLVAVGQSFDKDAVVARLEPVEEG